MTRDLVCFSHLRWDFVYQRPNHLMARAARDRRVFFIEEPILEGDGSPHMTTVVRDGVNVVTPRLPDGLDELAISRALARLSTDLFRAERIRRPVLWYYTPMALPWTRQLDAGATVYDSMDYLAGFRGAPPELLELETELIDRADLVFSGGASLHERMRRRHADAHAFPSSVDVTHFGRARGAVPEPPDQAVVARPRIGYAGVIDERIDLPLIDGVAAARPDWQVILVGPVAKIAEDDLPRRSNIHYLGRKEYAELPTYLAGWDIGWMPFARNEATRYISPTKTPEYLAAGLPVVSTSIRDVVEPYGTHGLVAIADDVEMSVGTLESALSGAVAGRDRVDSFLATRSWDRTWAAMAALVDALDQPRPAVVDDRRRVAVAPMRRIAVGPGPSVGVAVSSAASNTGAAAVPAGRAAEAS
ncbi:MAG TPA: glycosyltransferase [Methylomirabilota bacterium]|nr:glycosyltransferase [Methylomirabilota bacterium]